MKKKMVWVGVFLILAVFAAIFISKMGGKAVKVDTAAAVRGAIEEYIEETGNAVLEEETEVFAAASGKVLEASKKPGDEVKAGEILVRLDNTDLLLQIKGLEAQKLSVSAKYAEEKSSSNNEELDKLKALLRSAEASYNEAVRVNDNNRALYEAGAISLDTYKGSVTKLAAAEASLESARSDLALSEKGLSANISRQYQAQLTEIQTRIDQLKKKNEDMIVRAPIEGTVLSADVKKGSTVQAGAKLYEIGGSKGIYIESEILIEDMDEIHVGSKVRIEDEDLGIGSMSGTVRKVYPKAVSVISDLGIQQKRVKVEISLEKAYEGLKPGYETVIRIITQRKETAVIIPDKAIFEYQGKDHVFVVEAGIAKLREITRGLESDDQVEVLTGVKEGETVILKPDDALKEGTPVE